MEGYWIQGYDNFTIGSAITVSDTSDYKPGTAYPATSNWRCLGGYVASDNVSTWLNSLMTGYLNSGNFTTGSEQHCDLSTDNATDRGRTQHTLWGLSDGSTKNLVHSSEDHQAAYANWTSSTEQFYDLRYR